jgi:2,3-bisphosphoglycerate-independent phosphoglycerate mutase
MPEVRFVCLTEYDPTIPAPVAFAKELPDHVLADVLADAGLRQLHIAETEKYAHVTFFLNGGVETPKKGETRRARAESQSATYDLQPEMSAPEVTDVSSRRSSAKPPTSTS